MYYYIIQTIAFQLFFLLGYDLFLKKETFFNWNRVYLLGTSVLSLCIPLIKIESFKNVVSETYMVRLPEVFIGGQNNVNQPIQLGQIQLLEQGVSIWQVVFYLGLFIAGLLFLFKLKKILSLLIKNPKQKFNQFKIVNLSNSKEAFSFFTYIFVGSLINKHDREQIVKHEMVHVQHLHSVDLLFFEILRILFWFNPLIYLYQSRVMALHEFIADAEAVKHHNKADYYENLLQQVFGTQKISFINPFFKQSLIKKRIVMLTKSKSKKNHLFKYALLIPMITGMLIYSACSVQDNLGASSEDLNQYTYVVNLNDINSSKAALEYVIAAKENQINFIKSNPKYVIWVAQDEARKELKYTLHHESEKVPENYELITTSNETINYRMYGHVKFKRDGREKFLDASDVPFAIIDQVPVFPGCENLNATEQRACMSKNISKHVNLNFNTKIADSLGLMGRQRINVIFKIDKEGNVIGVRARAPHPSLEEEAKRVINTLPKMMPGEHDGKKVNVPYSLPIIFQVADAPKSE